MDKEEWLYPHINKFCADKMLKPTDVNIVHTFALKLAIVGTMIPLSLFTHAIINRFKLRNKKATIQNMPVFYETTLELIQHVSISLQRVSPYHNNFVGDSHSCTLYCVKCKCRFGITGSIFKVLAEAPFAILYHHGLELPEKLPSPSTILTDEEEMARRLHLSLPMHTMADHMKKF